MDNQHKQIKGYRDLSQAEIDLMNRIKAHAEETHALVEAVRTVVTPTLPLIECAVGEPGGLVEGSAIYAGHDAGPWRWICLADDHLQQGYMALTRAVAQPTTY
ncbi:Acb2/Tad1 domain-containing protein [Paraburkholderia fungorum]|uniref:Acb2/Tad1 domain-containing protein n=1 Tax=Paraburkholderia fungorum TaxID=134537 RepID=UPI001607B31B|nr:hypothetical protein [Paraburkholderia fungorum]MBB5547512.1 hypothetical protein [Paraburkholderia fungorum]